MSTPQATTVLPARSVPRSTRNGLLLAGATAAISGVSVVVNSYGVHDFTNAAVYTTAKNVVSALVLCLVIFAVPALRARPARGAFNGAASPGGPPTPPDWAAGHLSGRRLAALAYVGLVGGGLAFVLFFDGLARTSAVPAAFLHDTMVIWVALICWPALSERLSLLNVGALGALAVGEVALSGGIGHLSANSGNALVLAATLCWALETVIARRLLSGVSAGTLALVRMGGGSLALLVYLATSGELSALAHLDGHQLGWVLVTGVLLAGYVATWMAALSRARAVDVASVLVASVALSALIEAGLQRTVIGAQAGFGLGLVLLGVACYLVALRRRAPA